METFVVAIVAVLKRLCFPLTGTGYLRAALLCGRISNPAAELQRLSDNRADRAGLLLQLRLEPEAPECDCDGLQQFGELQQQQLLGAGQTTQT